MDAALQRIEEVEATGCQPRKIWRWESVGGLCLINGYRKGAELGVSGGRFTFHMCGWMNDMHMIAVDLWTGQPQRDAEGAETYEGRDHDQYYRQFKHIAETYFPGRIHIRRMSTLDAAKTVADGSLDFVFIDADHTEEACGADIDAWWPKVRRGGLLCGHDYNWNSVKRAVDARFNDIDEFESDHVWWRLVP